jgi:acetyl esterase/lipase
MRMGFPSIDENADGPLLTKPAMQWFVNHYLNGEEDRTDPLASPFLASNLRSLPPAFIITAECDPLRDEGEAYGLRLEEAGVPVDIEQYEACRTASSASGQLWREAGAPLPTQVAVCDRLSNLRK